MARNFNIDKNDLYAILDMLKDYQDDEDVLIDHYRIERIINRFENNFYEETEGDLIELIEDDLEKYDFFKPFYPLAEKFMQTGVDVDTFHFEPNYTPLDIPDEEAFSIVDDFFKEQGDFFRSTFNEFDEEADDHLEFVEPNCNTECEMVFLKMTGDAFVFCPNYSNFTKITILSHEVEHVIDSFKNSDFFDNLLIRETIAIFIEMLMGDYCAKKYHLLDDHFQRKFMLHIILKRHATIFIDKMDMLNIINSHRNLNENDLFCLLDEEGFSNDCVAFLMENTISEDFYYILAYLIAIELYFIYQSDRQKALTISEDIIMHGTDDNIFELLNKYDIMINQNVKKYENQLLKKIKK